MTVTIDVSEGILDRKRAVLVIPHTGDYKLMQAAEHQSGGFSRVECLFRELNESL